MMCFSGTSSHRRDARRWLLLALPLIGCDRAADAIEGETSPFPPPQLDYRPATHIPRLVWDSLAVNESDADDFALLHDTLVLLDRGAKRLDLLVRRDTRWHHVRYMGAAGDGPGRFRRPASVATGGDGAIHVLEDDGRVQRFDRNGSPPREQRLRFPCVPFRMSVALTSDDRLVVGGLCTLVGDSRDTVFALAWIQRPDSTLQELARTAVATVDLRWGGVPVTTRFVSANRGDVVFAAGTDGCWVTIAAGSPSPAAAHPPLGTSAMNALAGSGVRRECRTLPARYRGTRPPTWRDFKMPNGSIARWPDPFQPFSAAVWAPTVALIQMISNDSLVVNPIDAVRPADPLLVAPTRRFVGCADGRCLWFDAIESRVALVDVRQLAAAAPHVEAAR